MNTTLTDEPRQFRAPQTMTPYELGDSLARLVWESFTDFISQEDVETPLADIRTLYDDDRTNGRTAEEALIFFMWALQLDSLDGFVILLRAHFRPRKEESAG